MSDNIKIGTRIRFIKTLDEGPNEHSPGILFATKGELGSITAIGDCREGYRAKTDNWPSPFGVSIDEFEVIGEDDHDR